MPRRLTLLVSLLRRLAPYAILLDSLGFRAAPLLSAYLMSFDSLGFVVYAPSATDKI